jgi:hypothetical protein
LPQQAVFTEGYLDLRLIRFGIYELGYPIVNPKSNQSQITTPQ